ncbi:hypothetical protein [Tortoise microvirus 10]|nr:hypothetical protein [Tortoise microvirus 10]QCS37000.1 hypothetical protein [Tortoise microvirus 10]
MLINRFSGFSSVLNPSNVEPYSDSFRSYVNVESLCDKSYFMPMSESVKTVSSAPLSQAEINACYDFKDGRDSGARVPVDRYKGLDLAEVSNYTRKIKEAVDQDLKDAKADLNAKLSAESLITKSSEGGTPSS